MLEKNLHKNADRTTVFLHIPKTAGTTIYTIMDRQFKLKNTITINKEIEHIAKLQEISNLDSTRQKQIESIKGHTYLGWHKILPQKVNYFTILRNPIDRFISHYYYIKNLPSHPLYSFVNEKNISLTDFASIVGKDNGQTRFLATSIGEDEIEFKSEPCSTKILEKAKNNLQQYCDVVGIVEEFDKTLLLLKKRLSWQNIFYIVKNKNKKRVATREIAKPDLKVIERHHEFDLELYEYSKKVFQTQIEQQDDKFQEDLNNFRKLNDSAYGKFLVLTATSAVRFEKLFNTSNS